ncbi:MAG: hypothetical protein L6Q57_02460 [Alphaproteobacteria bacterium]|nr:hypothetical protein [Alphaproteobacteria bacterium]
MTVAIALEPVQAQQGDPYADLPDAYFEEADDFQNYCTQQHILRNYYDCQCLALAFLEARIEHGPDMSRSALMLEVQDQCHDLTNEMGRMYEDCLQSAPPATIASHDDYCACKARTYGQLFKAARRQPSAYLSVELQTQAGIACSNPDLAKRLYSQ